jgi:hypothetical protein
MASGNTVAKSKSPEATESGGPWTVRGALGDVPSEPPRTSVSKTKRRVSVPDDQLKAALYAVESGLTSAEAAYEQLLEAGGHGTEIPRPSTYN